MLMGSKCGITREREKSVVCYLSKLRLDFDLIWRMLLLSSLEFPLCSFHIILGEALQ